MSLIVWIMIATAIWHFTIFLPDRSWGGIVGCFVGSLFGAVLLGLAINGFTIPGRHDTHIAAALEAIPGSLVGILFVYFIGVRQEKASTADVQ